MSLYLSTVIDWLPDGNEQYLCLLWWVSSSPTESLGTLLVMYSTQTPSVSSNSKELSMNEIF